MEFVGANVFYICDRKQHCSNMSGCKNCGGDCIHTIDPSHAKNGPCKNPATDSRFQAEVFNVGNGKTATYYWEFEPNLEEHMKEQNENDI